MRALTGELLLSAWDRGTAEHDINRALTMLAFAMPETSREELAELSIAERNALLLQLRAITFGPVLNGYATCSACAAPLEFALPVDSLLAYEQQLPAAPREWSEDAQTFHLRPVNSNALLAALSASDAEQAEERLLSCCLTISGLHQASVEFSPASVREKFEQVNASAEIVCTLDCPACAKRETLDLDIVRFLWTEVRRAALRLLCEIHELACAYGWSERAIVTMSPSRRNAYREMLNA
jgi:hypothetical protein